MTTTDDDRGQTHFFGDGCDPPHAEPPETCRSCGADYPSAGDGWDGECPSCADRSASTELGDRFDDLGAVEERLRDDLDRCRATLRARRQERDSLAEQIRSLVAAEETLVSALRPFDRRRKQGP